MSDYDSESEPQAVLLGRDLDRLDIGVAANAYEKAKNFAFLLEGLVATPFHSWDRDDRLERVFEIVMDFAVHCRRYIELVDDSGLRNSSLGKSSANLTMWDALNLIVHAINFVPDYRNPEKTIGSGERDTLIVGATIRTDVKTSQRVEFLDFTTVFLDHVPSKLHELREEHEMEDEKRRAEFLLRHKGTD
ncbi:hypothetical protein K3556_12180 [Aliiroseovarius sp. M344]|uniref:hypothetical protein n=1 Tax=Aliiroseovarius sp. M344 TaxID=2867010 RepID=UPI0021AD635F|nr:hypothetical protein [Aliiroseovarius sp. M344]UWQ13681.1 hypothetical protein K3556_12180 [Aliiroseovarius sp. M344]